mmetsp:Transcript_98796/g.264180  ORF Transcript_98796/g.264180 Transcript_98796/m.264180 type:complete len:126 (-) Transcript_98796:20-397(-)
MAWRQAQLSALMTTQSWQPRLDWKVPFENAGRGELTHAMRQGWRQNCPRSAGLTVVALNVVALLLFQAALKQVALPWRPEASGIHLCPVMPLKSLFLASPEVQSLRVLGRASNDLARGRPPQKLH